MHDKISMYWIAIKMVKYQDLFIIYQYYFFSLFPLMIFFLKKT